MPGSSKSLGDPAGSQPSNLAQPSAEVVVVDDETAEFTVGSSTKPPSIVITRESSPGRFGAFRGDFFEGGKTPSGLAGAETFAARKPFPDLTEGSRIRYLGDYEIVDVLGRGGMGIVYRARQISLNRLVALKLIRVEGTPSESELRRFQHEAEAVASLDHPGIVPIYEVGLHEGRHYFSMKLIAGESLHAASPKLKGDYRAIVRVIVGVARALQHAHERGILHRDIKPSNILLDLEGTPHLGDFGLAKRFEPGREDASQTGAIVGTPAYMAPEQATAIRGAITTATDIYGLGGVLYALLSGHAPHRGSSVLEVLDAVREVIPEPLLKVDPTIPRDLEVICMKCLEKDPSRRYASAREVAEDLQRWLDGKPITARSVAPTTLAWMCCRRNPMVAGLAASLLISAIAGSIGILINWREVRRQRDEIASANRRIRAEWETSRRLNEFLVADLLAWSSPLEATRRDIPVSILLDRSAKLATKRFASQPKIEGSIHQILGHGYLTLGLFEKAEAELVQSYKLRQSLPEEDELDRLSTEYVLGRLRLEQGLYPLARVHAAKAYHGRRKRLGETDEATLEAAKLFGEVLKVKGEIEDARAILETTASIARRTLGNEHPLTLETLTDLAVIAQDQRRFTDSLDGFEQLERVSSRAFGSNHPQTLFIRSRLGALYNGLGNDLRAEEILAAILGPARDVLGPDHPETLRISGNLAAIKARLGKHAEAAQELEETIKAQRAALPADHVDTLTTELNRVAVLLQQGKAAEAEPILRALIGRVRSKLGDSDPMLGAAEYLLAATLLDLNKTIEAEPVITRAVAILGDVKSADHPLLLNAESLQAAIDLANGKAGDAEQLGLRLLEVCSKPGTVDSPWRLGVVKSVLGGAYLAQNKHADAERLLLDGFREVDGDPRAPARRRADALDRLIRFYESTGNPGEVAQWKARRATRPALE